MTAAGRSSLTGIGGVVMWLLSLGPIDAADDWPMWGRDPSRNMVSPARGLPGSFGPGQSTDGSAETDQGSGKNIKWVARLGSSTYGNPVVASGRVFVGTNNDPPKDPKYPEDRAVLLCLDEKTGKLVWQLAVPKLGSGSVSDYERVGLCSSPSVDGDCVYLVTNRCEVVCLDLHGLADGNDGPFREEPQYLAGPGRAGLDLGPGDADVIWRFDMRDELGVFPHQMTASSVLVVGQRLYATTSNGRNWTGKHMPSPDAPALICLDKNTGKLLGQEASGISRRTFLCNWSSPALGQVNGRDLVIFGGGDGFCYGFDPIPQPGIEGQHVLKEIWRFDCNPPGRRVRDGKPVLYGEPDGPCEVIATPVLHNGRVYVAVGQNPENGDGPGALSCIDAARQGDISASGKHWVLQDISRSLSTVAVANGLLFTADFSGIVWCVDAESGKVYWQHDLQSRIWASPVVADGKVYIGDESGVLTVFAASKDKRVLASNDFHRPIYSSVVVANGVLYVATENMLYAIEDRAGR